ncbi:MAG: hypothetical protein ACKVZJ_00865 [Phycisphaerales bacterium]
MSDQVFYFRGALPGRNEVSPALIEDLKSALRLAPEEFSIVVQGLQKLDGFLSRETLGATLNTAIRDTAIASAVESLVWNFAGGGDSQAEDWANEVTQWIRANPEHTTQFNNEEVERISEVLKAASRDIPGIARQHKALRVSQAAGLPLRDFQFVCELRPVFSRDDSSVDGLVSSTILRLAWDNDAGLPESIEFQLTQELIDIIREKSANLDKKQKALSDYYAKRLLRVTSPSGLSEAGQREGG